MRLHYHRPPDRTEIFEQIVLHRGTEAIVTLNPATALNKPMVIGDTVVFESGAPAIWFTFPNLMHDIGRFHTANGTFTGLYANMIMPVEMHSPVEWSATDLFLDVWIGRDQRPRVLDQDELEQAVARQWIDDTQAAAARAEAARILAAWQAGTWPPAIVNEWTIERVSKLPPKPERDHE